MNKPLLFTNEDPIDSLVLLKCPPPALHLKHGLNHIFKELMKVWPEMKDWLSGLHINFEPYHGETLEGKEVTRVLNNLDKLETALPDQFKGFHDFLSDFKKVHDSTFGSTIQV